MDGRHVVQVRFHLPLGVGERHKGPVAVAVEHGMQRLDPGRSVERRNQGARNQPREDQRVYVQMGMHDVEASRTDRFHAGGNVLLFQDPKVRRSHQQPRLRVKLLWSPEFLFRPVGQRVGYGLHQPGRGPRPGRRKERHLMPYANQFLRKTPHDLFPGTVPFRGNRPTNRREHRNSQSPGGSGHGGNIPPILYAVIGTQASRYDLTYFSCLFLLFASPLD